MVSDLLHFHCAFLFHQSQARIQNVMEGGAERLARAKFLAHKRTSSLPAQIACSRGKKRVKLIIDFSIDFKILYLINALLDRGF